MSHKTYQISSISNLDRMQSGSRTLQLPPSDVPTEFDVRARDGLLTIGFIYPQATLEPSSVVRMGVVDFVTGDISHRLLSVTLHIENRQKAQLQEIGDAVRRALLQGLRMLKDRSANEGARMNYSIAEAELVGNATMTPVWMSDALDTMRSGSPSGSGHRSR